VSIGYFGYKSLLETLALNPKKKHYKKVQHLLDYEERENVHADLISLFVRIGIEEKYPVFLG
jgi:hypothetical protein